MYDLTAARIHALPALYQAAAAGLPVLADPGYDGAGIGIHIPVREPADGGAGNNGAGNRVKLSSLLNTADRGRVSA